MWVIRDSTNDVQQLPLNKLLSKVLIHSHGDIETRWTVCCARGYGYDVCQLDDMAQKSDITVVPKNLIDLTLNTEQWFYDLRCEDKVLNLQFGLFDSTYLYLDGNITIVKNVVKEFANVEWISSKPFIINR